MTKQQFIEFQKEQFEWLKHPKTQTNVGNLIRVSWEQYSKPEHFIFEFIQNAEDATREIRSKTKKIRFLIEEDKIIIINNGKQFDIQDVKSISSIDTTKLNKRTIGYWGIGFKSAFLLSDKIQIFSDDFRFEFNKEEYSKLQTEKLDLFALAPFWKEELPENIKEFYDEGETVFVIYFKNKNHRNLIKERLNDIINLPTILFLESLNEIEVIDGIENETIKLEKVLIDHKDDESFAYKEYRIKQNNKEDKNWIIISKRLDISEELKSDEKAFEQKKYFIEKKEPIFVETAFELDKNRNFVKNKGRIFSYLPTQEIVDLNFFINSSFVLNSTRERLIEQSRWNEWILSELTSIIIRATDFFKKDTILKFKFYDIIPIFQQNVSEDDWLKTIINNQARKIAKEINSLDIILDFDEKFKKPIDVFNVTKDQMALYSLFQKREITNNLDIDKPLIHDKLLDCEGFVDLVKRNIITPIKFTEKELLALLNDKNILNNKQKNLDWFKNLYLFTFKIPFVLSKYEIGDIALFLNENLQLCSINNIYIKPETEILENDFRDINFLHDSINQYIKENEINIPIEQLNEISLIKNKISPQFANPEGKEKQLIDYTKLIFNVFRKTGNREILEGIRFKTSDGWLIPHECYLSENFLPEELKEIGKLFSQLNLPIITNEYLSEQEEFYDFLIESGVRYRIFLTDESIFKTTLDLLNRKKDMELFHLFLRTLIKSMKDVGGDTWEERFLGGGRSNYINKDEKSKMNSNIALLQKNTWILINGKWLSPENVFISNEKIVGFEDALPIICIDDLSRHGKNLLEKIGFKFEITLEDLEFLLNQYSLVGNQEKVERVRLRALDMFINHKIAQDELTKFVSWDEIKKAIGKSIITDSIPDGVTKIEDWNIIDTLSKRSDKPIMISVPTKKRIIRTIEEIEDISNSEEETLIFSPQAAKRLIEERRRSTTGLPIKTMQDTGSEGEEWFEENWEKCVPNSNKFTIKNRTKDKIGYDFELIDKNTGKIVKFIEVKTITGYSNIFNLTKNEFEYAKEKGQLYEVFVIVPTKTGFDLKKVVKDPAKHGSPIVSGYSVDFAKL
ncbi:MAG: DUF3883 domain-containing protein [Nanoarchaeota archaeon]